jgi:hypothetical protein
VGCALIRALPEWAWTAVKITPDLHDEHGDGVLADREIAGLAATARPPRVFVEHDQRSQKGTGRFLAAGARRAVLVTVAHDWDGGVLAEVEAEVAEGIQFGNVLVESNRFLSEVVIRLVVTGVTAAEWKHTFHRCVDEADALVLTGGMKADRLPEQLLGRRIFTVGEEDWAPAQLVDFVRERLGDQSRWVCGGARS